MTEYYFTADWHLNHKRILKLSNRPFSTIEEHDNTILSNINNIVSKDDYLFILGDLGYCKDIIKLREILKSLNGRKTIIVGNHDNLQYFVQLKREGIIEDVRESKTLQVGRIKIFMSHYPYLEWSGYYRGVLHAHGHTHNNLPKRDKCCDIGVDAWNFKPVSLDELLEYINRKETK